MCIHSLTSLRELPQPPKSLAPTSTERFFLKCKLSNNEGLTSESTDLRMKRGENEKLNCQVTLVAEKFYEMTYDGYLWLSTQHFEHIVNNTLHVPHLYPLLHISQSVYLVSPARASGSNVRLSLHGRCLW